MSGAVEAASYTCRPFGIGGSSAFDLVLVIG